MEVNGGSSSIEDEKSLGNIMGYLYIMFFYGRNGLVRGFISN